MQDFASNLYAGFDAGRKRAIDQRDMQRSERANALLGQAYANPNLRPQLLNEIAQQSPDIAYKAAEAFAAQDDRLNTSRGNFARAYLNIQDPAGRQKFAQHQSQSLQALGFDVGSADFEGQLSGYAQMGASTAKSLSPRMESLIWARDNGTITPEQFKQGVLVEQQLAPGASAPGITYIDQWNPNTQSVEKIPVLSRGLDYTGGSPSLGGGQPAPQPAPAPAGNYPDALVGVDDGGEVDAEFADLPPALRAEAAALAKAGKPFHIAGGKLLRGLSGGQQPVSQPQPRPASRPLPPLSQWGAGDERGGGIQSKPSFAEEEAQAERVAAAGARGRLGAEEDFGPNFERESNLRKEYLSAVAAPNVVIGAYDKVKDAATSGNAAGDMSMIFAYMKMLDPGSTVREGEYASARDTTGIPGQVLNLYNKALDGQFLSPQQRSSFVSEAGKIAASAEQSITEANEYYGGIAEEYKMDPRRIVRGDKKPKDAQQESYEVGDIVEIGGRQYRATTSGANPELEEL